MPQLMSKPDAPGEMIPSSGSNAATRRWESRTPVAIGHAERVAMDAGQAGDVGDLIEDPTIHGTQNGRARINSRRDQHALFLGRWNFPQVVVDAVDACRC